MMRRLPHSRWASFNAAVFGAVALGLSCPSPAVALQGGASPPAPPESVTIVAGARYQAGALHRWVAGNGYRTLWTTPIGVPVLDLRTYAGGLHPTKEGGGLQTRSLRFEGADGAEYVFRLSDKSIHSAPKQLKGTPAIRVFQDQISALHPAGAIMTAPILDASGILHPTAVLMVMPDDPLLGKYRAEFGGELGMLEEFPTVPKDGPAFGGASKIIDSDELLKLLDSDATQHVNARAFLTARLADFLINDNDRHPGNWKWARLASGPKTPWEPLARDRDHAFVSYNGVMMSLVRLVASNLVLLDDAPNVRGLTQSRGLDARLLAGLERPVWDSVASALQARITDSVIAAAVYAMPVEYHASAPRLEALLRKRRDALHLAADQFYRQLAARVEVHATDASDRADVTRVNDGLVGIRLESGGRQFFARQFDARETSEILVYLHGGSDTVLVTGRVGQSILVRVIGGNGTNTLVDSSTVAGTRHPTRLYDAGTVDGISYGLDTLFERRPWEKKDGELGPHGRDDGVKYAPLLGLGFHRRIGITPRLGAARYTYGFAKRPYSSALTLQGEYAVAYQGFRVRATADKRLELSPLHFTAEAQVSNIEVVRFNGLGNATIDSGNTYFDVHQTQWMFHPAIGLQIGAGTDLSLGPVVQHSTMDSARSRYLSAAQPYGAGTFNQAGVQVGARYQWRVVRNDEEHTHHRVLVDLNGFYFPAVMDVRSAFQAVSASAGTSVTLAIPTHPFLVLRGGGKKLFGEFPFYEAAFIGGEGTTRYMDTQRFAGDASLYGTMELRIPLVRFKLGVPLRAGVLGLAEAGRVYVDGRSPGGWYSRTGEGIWFGKGDLSPVVTFTRTTEPGRTGIHIRLGLNF